METLLLNLVIVDILGYGDLRRAVHVALVGFRNQILVQESWLPDGLPQ